MISFIVTAYKEKTEANIFINSLLLQDNPNWECIVYCDEHNDYIKNLLETIGDSRFRYYENEIAKGYWGHENRKYALENLVQGDFVIQTSIQDYYIPTTISIIEPLTNNYDFIFFDCIHNGFGYEILRTQPQICKIDWGSFVVRTQLAKKVGIENINSRITDGIFVERLFRIPKLKYYKINKILTIHN